VDGLRGSAGGSGCEDGGLRVCGQVGLDHATERVVLDRHVGFGLREGRVRGRGDLGGGDEVLGVGDCGGMLVALRAYSAGRTSWAWLGVLCIGVRICLIKLAEEVSKPHIIWGFEVDALLDRL
jgi:hypothetical protein